MTSNQASEFHCWLPNNLRYAHYDSTQQDDDKPRPKSAKQTNICKYMDNLIKDFGMAKIDNSGPVYEIFKWLSCVLPKHVQNQWLLSVYVCNQGTHSNLSKIKSQKDLAFIYGFELCCFFRCKELNDKYMVYVNDCAFECSTFCTALQIHENQQSGLHNQGILVSESCKNNICVVLRRIPRVFQVNDSTKRVKHV